MSAIAFRMVRFRKNRRSAEGRVLPIGGDSAEGRLSSGLRSVAARTAGRRRTPAGDDMIVVELWNGKTRPGADARIASNEIASGPSFDLKMPRLPYSIELHDSEIASVSLENGTATVNFSHAYVHSDGKGWSRSAQLRVYSAMMESGQTGYPAKVADGRMKTKLGPYHNLLMLPLDTDGCIDLEFEFFSGNFLRIKGEGIDVVFTSEPVFVEDYEAGTDKSEVAGSVGPRASTGHSRDSPVKKGKARLLRLFAVWVFIVGSGAVAGYLNSPPHESYRGLSVGAILGFAIAVLCELTAVPEGSGRISDGYRLLLSGLVGLGTAVVAGILCGASFAAFVWWSLIGFGLGITFPWWGKHFTF